MKHRGGARTAPFKHRMTSVLTGAPFVLCLVTLIANDVWLKAAYPGWLTGKLSDFAGIAVVSLLAMAAGPQRTWRVMATLVAAFAWWKSPLSQPFVDAVNVAPLPLIAPIGRVVDYSDLLALCVIPLCSALARQAIANTQPISTGHQRQRWLVAPIACATFFGLTATSSIPLQQSYQVRQASPSGAFNRQDVADTIAEVAALHGLACRDCADRTVHAVYAGDAMWLDYRFVDRSVQFSVRAHGGWPLGTSVHERADRLRADLKARLAGLHPGLEYIEALESKPAR